MRLTLTPGAMSRADIDALRAVGFDDAQITIAVQVVGYFNSINRVADALGVDPEPWMTLDRDQWLARKARDWQQG